MSWYKEGSVNIEQGSKTVIGNDTKWTNPLIGVCAGQMLILKTAETIEIYEIASIQSDTQLTLANKYNGVTKTGVSYEIPTAPKVSIEALALRISEMLNYYQQQMDGWQSILTGEGEVTLTAPDGRVVTIKSQYSIANELIEYVKASKKLAESSTKSAELANQFAISANNASSSAKNSESSAKTSAEAASKSAQAASQSANNASDSAELAKISEINSKTSEANAAQSAIDAKNAAESINTSIDTSNFIKKSGENSQSISGSLNVNELTENGERVYSPNNKPTADDIGALAATKTVVNNVTIYQVGGHVVFSEMVGDQRLMPFRANELPFGWYFRNGDNYLLSSPQGQALNSLSANYKNDYSITIKDINGQQYINVPNAFHSDGRGYFERAVNGTTRQVGSIENDAIRNIQGQITTYNYNTTDSSQTGAFRRVALARSVITTGNQDRNTVHDSVYFDAAFVVPTASENRPLNIGMNPVIYLGV